MIAEEVPSSHPTVLPDSLNAGDQSEGWNQQTQQGPKARPPSSTRRGGGGPPPVGRQSPRLSAATFGRRRQLQPWPWTQTSGELHPRRYQHPLLLPWMRRSPRPAPRWLLRPPTAPATCAGCPAAKGATRPCSTTTTASVQPARPPRSTAPGLQLQATDGLSLLTDSISPPVRTSDLQALWARV